MSKQWHAAHNGQQVGPISEEELRRRLQGGEFHGQTLVWTEGMPQWTAAGQVPGLMPISANVQTGGAVPPPVLPQSVAYFVPQGKPELGQDAGMRLLIPVGRSGWAIAAGYLGLLSLFGGFLAPVALVISFVALSDLRKKPQSHGMGRVITGFVGGALGMLMLVGVIMAIVSRR